MSRTRTRLLPLLALVLSLSPGIVLSADDGRQPAGDRTPAAEEEKKCVHGCQRWGQHCNIDPRGVRKCRRVCERFGEICE